MLVTNSRSFEAARAGAGLLGAEETLSKLAIERSAVVRCGPALFDNARTRASFCASAMASLCMEFCMSDAPKLNGSCVNVDDRLRSKSRVMEAMSIEGCLERFAAVLKGLPAACDAEKPACICIGGCLKLLMPPPSPLTGLGNIGACAAPGGYCSNLGL